MSRAALAHALGLEDKPLALRVHDVKGGLLVVEPVGGEGAVDGVIDVFHVEGAQGLPVPLHGALDGVGPGAHMVQVGPGNGHTGHLTPGGEIQPLLGERLPVVGDAIRPARQDQGELHQGPVAGGGEDEGLRVLRPGGLPGEEGLELRLVVQDGLDGALDEIQAFAQVLDGGGGHFLGGAPGHHKYNCAEHAEDEKNGEGQGEPPPTFPFFRILFHAAIDLHSAPKTGRFHPQEGRVPARPPDRFPDLLSNYTILSILVSIPRKGSGRQGRGGAQLPKKVWKRPVPCGNMGSERQMMDEGAESSSGKASFSA